MHTQIQRDKASTFLPLNSLGNNCLKDRHKISDTRANEQQMYCNIINGQENTCKYYMQSPGYPSIEMIKLAIVQVVLAQRNRHIKFTTPNKISIDLADNLEELPHGQSEDNFEQLRNITPTNQPVSGYVGVVDHYRLEVKSAVPKVYDSSSGRVYNWRCTT